MVQIHREAAKSNFLGIKNENWMAAARDLSAHALKLYFYLAANADNYKLALSPAAVRQDIGMARSTFHDQFHVLVDKGYLVHAHGNTYDFYEVPKSGAQLTQNSELSDGYNFEDDTAHDNGLSSGNNSVLPENIQINNNGTTDGINKDDKNPKTEGWYNIQKGAFEF